MSCWSFLSEEAEAFQSFIIGFRTSFTCILALLTQLLPSKVNPEKHFIQFCDEKRQEAHNGEQGAVRPDDTPL